MNRCFKIILAIAMTSCVAVAPAHARPDTRTMTCQQAVAIIKQYKSIVLSTGRFTYDRYVAQQGFCGPTQQTTLAVAPTIDNPRCRIGYRCTEMIDTGR